MDGEYAVSWGGSTGAEEWHGVERKEKIKMDNMGIYINVTDK